MSIVYVNTAVAFIVLMSMIAAGVWINHRKLKVEAAKVGCDAELRREVVSLTGENRELRDHVSYLEDRIGVLERIATDPAERTAREIESLRATPNQIGQRA
jgi:hypothetical protein